MIDRLRSAVARSLETGALAAPWSLALARVHGDLRRAAVARPLVVPSEVRIVTVGGATLGGSGKTRVALAVARFLAERGVDVVLVGHAYRARPARARVVSPEDRLEDVGDEALACARALARGGGSGVAARVIVAPTRQAAVDFAASRSPRPGVLVVDGPLQLAPVRASLALLAVDAEAPWGAGALPPAGDLIAPREALLEHADLVVAVDPLPRAAVVDGVGVALASLGATAAGRRRLGLFTALGRPERLVQALARAGVALSAVVHASDHGPVTRAVARRLADAKVELWLATEKCAVHLARELGPASQIAALDAAIALPPELEARLEALAGKGG